MDWSSTLWLIYRPSCVKQGHRTSRPDGMRATAISATERRAVDGVGKGGQDGWGKE